MPVRDIFKNRGKKFIGIFPSIKMNRVIQWESPLEKDYIYLLECDSQIMTFEEQPIQIIARVEGKIHHYTPDFKVETQNGVCLVEVKPTKNLQDSHTKLQIAIGQAYCRENGIDYKVITEKDIRSGNQLKNARILIRYSRIKVPLKVFHKIINTAIEVGSISIHELCVCLERRKMSEPLPYIYHLVFKNNLSVDLNEELTTKSVVLGVNF